MKRKSKKPRFVPEITVPEGYDLTDIMDTDYADFTEEPARAEEVTLRFEQDEQQ